jgi:4-diphosphocytidyl-2-C-methyl-D-erythritol kinase
MEAITIKAFGKINLALNVLGKRSDGYHEVEMIMGQVDLFDLVTVSLKNLRNNDGTAIGEEEAFGGSISLDKIKITIITGANNIPKDSRNLAYKGCMALLKELNRKHFVGNGLNVGGGLLNRAEESIVEIQIEIDKKIPVAAGLAGGSTDAAASMIALNILLGSPLTNDELIALGKEVGADVAFCIMGNLYNYLLAENKNLINGKEKEEKLKGLSSFALAEGIGEKLKPIIGIKALKDTMIVISKPKVYLSTREIYSKLKLEEIQKKADVNELITGLMEDKLDLIKNNMINALESVTLKEYPIVMYTKNMISLFRAEAVLMSGSGPSVYGIFKDQGLAIKALAALKEKNPETYMVKMK